jgi:NAD(P)-dependent dehydrogenase (short-subunit alcohol dehydrogenase family)
MKNVVVTGCSRGIGLAIAEVLLASGYTVWGTSTTGNHQLSHANFKSCSLQLDNEDSIKSFQERLQGVEIWGLVNNAAILLEAWGNSKIDMPQFRKTFEVNVFGTIALTEAMLPAMTAGSHIVNISSGWGTFSDASFDEFVPHYKMSKVTLNMYTKLLAKRVASQQIRVSAYDPGWVKTDMGGQSATDLPEEVAIDVLRLMEDEQVKSGRLWYKGKPRDW